MTRRSPLVALLFASLLLFYGCAPEDGEMDDAVPAEDTVAVEDDGSEQADEEGSSQFDGTVDRTEYEASGEDWVTLRSVRTAAQNGHDRVVFEFDEDVQPSHRVEYLDGPATHCASGQEVPVDGEAILSIQLSPAVAHTFDDDDERHPTIEETDRQVELEPFRHIREICDHHGGVEWAIGLDEELPYRVLQLEDPTRLVVDVRPEEE